MLLAGALAGSGLCAAEPPGLLALYANSSLIGMHSHAIGVDGAALAAGERTHNHKRARVAERLATLCGRAALAEIDDEQADAAQQVVYVRSLTDQEERARLTRARLALSRLDRRLKQEIGR